MIFSTESEVPPSSAVSEFLYALYDLRDITKLQALIFSSKGDESFNGAAPC